MGYAAKVVLHAPLKNSEALEPFVEDCLRDKVVLIAVVGEGCQEIETLIDEIIVGDGSDPERFIATTSHPEESIEDVMNFAKVFASKDGREGVQRVAL